MTLREIGDELARLVRLDVDAVLAYDRAIAGLGPGPIATELAMMKLDHQRHVLELSQAMLGLGLSPPEASPDVKGSLLGGVTALRARFGPEQALQAMRVNERLTSGTYAKALAKPFPDDLLEVIRRGAGDEARHLSWIERALDGRIWEREGASP